MAQFVITVKTNLDGMLRMTHLDEGLMMIGDDLANRIVVELYRNNTKIDIGPSDSIIAYIVRPDNYTLLIQGSIVNGNAIVDIPALACAVEGRVSIAVRWISGSSKTVIAALNCYVHETSSGHIIDPNSEIPDVEDIIAYINTLDSYISTIDTKIQQFDSAESSRVAAEQNRVLEHAASIGKIDNMTVSAQTVQNTENATAVLSQEDGHYHIQFGLPQGPKGDTGDSGTTISYDSQEDCINIVVS